MKINVFRQSSIKIEDNNLVIYFDPYKITEDFHDADYIFITHEHYDHYDEEAINKLLKDKTKLIVPECLKNINYEKIVVKPDESYNLDGFSFKTVRAYNIDKTYHPRDKDYVGYIVNLNNISYYIMGDTDVTEEVKKIKCDILFVPIGGVYTMDMMEALEYVNEVKPKKVIPIHYGSIVGDISLGEKFKDLVNKDIEVEIYIEEEK